MSSPDPGDAGASGNPSLEQMLAIEPGTGVIASVSPALERILGFAEGSLSGRHVNELGSNRLPTAEFTKFVGRAGHDLIGPLNQACTLLALFHKRCKDVQDPGARELAKYIETASQKIAGLVEGLGKYLEVVGRRRTLQTIDSKAALSSALFRLDEKIKKSGARINQGELPELYTDPTDLISIFTELLDNAIKFSKPPDPPAIDVTARLAGSEWTFSIRDNGAGVPTGQTMKALEPFARLHGSEYPGAGMGLAITKVIVEANGGRIWIESEPGRGSVVQFTIRAYDAV